MLFPREARDLVLLCELTITTITKIAMVKNSFSRLRRTAVPQARSHERQFSVAPCRSRAAAVRAVVARARGILLIMHIWPANMLTTQDETGQQKWPREGQIWTSGGPEFTKMIAQVSASIWIYQKA